MQVSARRRSMAAIAVLFFSCSHLFAQSIQTENIPEEFLRSASSGPFARSYGLDGAMNPFYLRGDFDGDAQPDYAFWIKSKKHGEVGIAVWLSSLQGYRILGAGTPFKVSGLAVSNLDFLNTWQIYGKGPVERGVEAGSPPHLLGDALLVGKSESASGLIYWNGKSFVWYQQGD